MHKKLTATHDLAVEVARLLTEQGLTMATAESCTGGGIGATLTDLAGSSQWFSGGVISYSNSAKAALLEVPAALIESYGAVSAEVVEAMAQGGCRALRADICVAVSGVAGPSGGSKDKPVGTVWIAWAQTSGAVSSRLYSLDGDRSRVRKSTINEALKGLIETISISPLH
jgi:nicotinamide-nucleotide amidase